RTVWAEWEVLLSGARGGTRLGFDLRVRLAASVRDPGAGPRQDLDLEHRGHEGPHTVIVERDRRAAPRAEHGDARAVTRGLDRLAALEHHEPVLSVAGAGGAGLPSDPAGRARSAAA